MDLCCLRLYEYIARMRIPEIWQIKEPTTEVLPVPQVLRKEEKKVKGWEGGNVNIPYYLKIELPISYHRSTLLGAH